MVDHNFMRRVTPFLVLEILRHHTDEDHGLKVTQIVELLQKDYSITIERKALSRILVDLWELSQIPENYDWKYPVPFTIRCKVTRRSTGDIRDDWRFCERKKEV